MTRRAVVLGAGGFIGSHLCRRLTGSGWTVTAVVRQAGAAHVRRRLSGLPDRLRLIEGDAADEELLEAVVEGADAVFPLAGRSGAAASMAQPAADLDANGRGQLMLLEVLRRRNPAARVVFPGSRLQYGRCERLPVGEDHPQRPLCIYGTHKALGEQYHQLYWRMYGLPTTVLRISNPYGPQQERPDGAFGLVGNFISRAARGQPIHLYGGGGQLRDYLYVEDLCCLIELAATVPAAVGQAFNAGGPERTTVRGMAEAVLETVGGAGLHDVPWPELEAAVETGDYVSDHHRARELLGWEPQVTLAEGLARTWASLAPGLAS